MLPWRLQVHAELRLGIGIACGRKSVARLMRAAQVAGCAGRGPGAGRAAADESRLTGVATRGVDEHVWHHTPHKSAAKGPTMLTGMVDTTRDGDGNVHARLLDLVPGRSATTP